MDEVNSGFETKRLPGTVDEPAPDGSEVRVLLRLEGGSMAHFRLAAGLISTTVRHRTLEEIWFFLGGRGEMWRQLGTQGETVGVEQGICITIPRGTGFQFRSFGPDPLEAVAITMPPWSGAEGEVEFPDGPWTATGRNVSQ